MTDRTISIVDRGLEVQFDSIEEASQWVHTQLEAGRNHVSQLRTLINELEEQRSDAKEDLERIRQMGRSLADKLSR